MSNSMKKALALLLCLVLCVSLLPVAAFANGRTQIHEIRATAQITPPAYGGKATQLDITADELSHTYSDNEDSHWYKTDGSDEWNESWVQMTEWDTFDEGTYVYRTQFRIDGEEGTDPSAYVLAEDAAVYVNNVVWKIEHWYAEENYSYVAAMSPNYTVAKKQNAVNLIISTRNYDNTLMENDGGSVTLDKEFADPGETVKIEATPWSSFRLEKIFWGDGGAIEGDITDSREFVMWDKEKDVTVDVVFRHIGPEDARKVTVVVSTFGADGHAAATVGGSAFASLNEAMAGETVTIYPNAFEGYKLMSIEWGNGVTVGEDITNARQFAMWEENTDVIVDVSFQVDDGTPDIALDTAELTLEIPAPKEGLEGATPAVVTPVDSNSHFTVLNAYWYYGGDIRDPDQAWATGLSPDAFVAGRPYFVEFDLVPHLGYRFTEDSVIHLDNAEVRLSASHLNQGGIYHICTEDIILPAGESALPKVVGVRFHITGTEFSEDSPYCFVTMDLKEAIFEGEERADVIVGAAALSRDFDHEDCLTTFPEKGVIYYLPVDMFAGEEGNPTVCWDDRIISQSEYYADNASLELLEMWRSPGGRQAKVFFRYMEWPADTVIAGFCGESLVWSIDQNGTLTISGTGFMYDYIDMGVPWANYVGWIRALDLKEGVAYLGANAFREFSALTSVTIPASVTIIGDCAFGQSSVSELHFLGKAPVIVEDSFAGVQADAYYPAGDDTWSDDARRNYGGKLTWIEAAPTKPVITEQPASVTVAAGKTASFTVKATGADLQYQWYYKATLSDAWTAVKNNGTSATYTLTAEERHNGYQYRCRVKNTAGQVFTGAVTLTVATKPVITAQPQSVTVAAGKTATFKVTATGVDLQYQWYYKAKPTDSWTAVKNNGTSATYTLTTAERHNGYQYRCRVKNAAGLVFTGAVKLTVATKPVITAQPQSVTVAAGKTATFKVTATGVDLQYQWYYKAKPTDSWTAVKNNGTSATYTLTTAARHNGYQYRCRVKNTAGQVFTETAKLTVAVKPVITAQPKSVSVKAGEKAAFTVKASGEGIAYQWYYKAPGGEWTPVSAASGKTATYTLTAAERHNGYQYRCRVKNAAGLVFTETVKLTVN